MTSVNLAILKKIPFNQYPWYFTVQILSILVPLISYPYLLRIIGPEKYGLIAVAASTSAIIATISDYGASFTGVRDIARFSDDVQHTAKYFFNSIVLRLIVFLFCLLLLIPIYYLVPLLQNEIILFGLTFASLIPALIFPQWLFVGLQKMRQYNALLFLNKLISVGLVFIIITQSDDYKIFPLTQLIPSIVSAIICLFYLNILGIRFKITLIGNIRQQFLDGFLPFLSQGLTSLYVQLNPLFLMLLINNATLVGYYAVAEKIVVMTKSLFSPLNQLFLPNISKQFFVSVDNAIAEIKQYSKFIAIVNFIGMVLLIIFAEHIVILIAGEQYTLSANTVRFLSPILLFVGLNNLAGVHVLLNLEMKKEFFFGIVIGVILNIMLLFLLTPMLSFNAPAISWSISEGSVLVVFVYFIYKRKVKL